MILHRVVFQAQFGKANALVAQLKTAIMDGLSEEQLSVFQPRILTDLSGSFDTVVLETTHESLATYEQFRTAMFEQNSAAGGPSVMSDLVASGRNEYYTIET